MQVPFSKAIENAQLMHECSPKQLRMGTVRLKQGKETDESRQVEESWKWKIVQWAQKCQWPSCSSGLLSSQGHYSSKQGMHCVMNLTNHIIHPLPARVNFTVTHIHSELSSFTFCTIQKCMQVCKFLFSLYFLFLNALCSVVLYWRNWQLFCLKK